MLQAKVNIFINFLDLQILILCAFIDLWDDAEAVDQILKFFMEHNHLFDDFLFFYKIKSAVLN